MVPFKQFYLIFDGGEFRVYITKTYVQTRVHTAVIDSKIPIIISPTFERQEFCLRLSDDTRVGEMLASSLFSTDLSKLGSWVRWTDLSRRGSRVRLTVNWVQPGAEVLRAHTRTTVFPTWTEIMEWNAGFSVHGFSPKMIIFNCGFSKNRNMAEIARELNPWKREKRKHLKN